MSSDMRHILVLEGAEETSGVMQAHKGLGVAAARPACCQLAARDRRVLSGP